MQEPLDYLPENEPRRSLFAKCSLIFAICTWGLLFYIAVQTPTRMTASESLGHTIMPYIAIKWTYISLAFGVVASITSLARKEKIKLVKTLGISLNAILVVLYVAVFLFLMYS